jgi:RNA polymerase-binding transcription factor DksA
MSNTELEHYRQLLLALGRRLRGDVEGVANEALRQTGGEPSGSLSNAPLHTADLGTDMFEQEMSLDLLENEDALLAHTAAALERIEKGTFGRCRECGMEIPHERLQAIPYTPYCVGCARRLQAGADRTSLAPPP